MAGRFILVVTFGGALVVASTPYAHADPPPRSLLWQNVPPAPADTSAPRTFGAALERFFASRRSSTFAMGGSGAESLGRGASTSLGVRPRGPSASGASLAALGAGAGALSRRATVASGVTIGPRLYSGGGGIGVSVGW
jgi:hypothetical protein